MAWNTPGSDNSGGSNRPPRSRRPGNRGLDQLLDPLRGLFGGAGGGDGIWRWVAIVLGLWVLFNSFVLITEQQRGVVLRFGQFARVLQPGPHLKAPWPIERVTKVNATEIKTFSETVPVLTSDENIVNVAINVQYKIGDPQQYLFGTRNGDEVLKQATLSTVREQVGRATLDTVLGARAQLGAASERQLQRSLDTYRTGLLVTELNLPDARPPQEVKPAFDDVNSAQQDKERLISESRAYAAKIVPEARGEAARTRTVAEGYKASAIARATGDAQRFSLLVDEYKAAPEVTRKRLWLDTVQQVLADNRTIVGGDSRQLIYVPMDGQGGNRAAGPAPALTPELLGPVTSTPQAQDTRPARDARPNGREESTR
ncbi:FtsH protease activity modulator HflK [Cognatilysobacter tabacisoli]|uniref:FtsH protease activity modulator HflK n=1 Tax=Cognatilysobacter tabacisoli TaxID=2315424 RepID=UPI000E6B2557|nr:FtsH protease activity modulator HflK [Lysobacter tabacisoli]